MTRIYEALNQAGLEREAAAEAQRQRHARPLSLQKGAPKHRGVEAKLIALYQRIDAMLKSRPGAVVQFVSVQGNQEASNIAREFTRVAAERLGRNVLLLTSGPTPEGTPLAPVQSGDWLRIIEEARRPDNDERVHPFPGTEPQENSRNEVMALATSQSALVDLAVSEQSRNAFSVLREHFDMILIDAPPLADTGEAILQSALADGVVLVVQAEKTRWQVARHWIDQVEANGGRVLGVILNGKRWYIPRFIYRWLAG
jgi:hypothetical protein